MKDAKEFLEQGTALSGYEAHGPYHCSDCRHLEGTLCIHPIVILDPALKSMRKGHGVEVDAEHGCCRYISQPLETEDEDDAPEPLRKVLK